MKTKPSPHLSTPIPAGDDLAAILTALHGEKYHPGRACCEDERGRCDAIDRSTQ